MQSPFATQYLQSAYGQKICNITLLVSAISINAIQYYLYFKYLVVFALSRGLSWDWTSRAFNVLGIVAHFRVFIENQPFGTVLLHNTLTNLFTCIVHRYQTYKYFMPGWHSGLYMLTNALQVRSQPGTDLFVLSVSCCEQFLASLCYQEYSCVYHTWGS